MIENYTKDFSQVTQDSQVSCYVFALFRRKHCSPYENTRKSKIVDSVRVFTQTTGDTTNKQG